MDHAGAGAVNEQPADIRIAALADPKQGRFASRGVLSRNQTKPSSEIAGFAELAGISNRGNQSSRTNRPNPRDRHEPTGCVILRRERLYLP